MALGSGKSGSRVSMAIVRTYAAVSRRRSLASQTLANTVIANVEIAMIVIEIAI